MLCFTYRDDFQLIGGFQECHSFDGTNTQKLASTEFKYPRCAVANYKNSAFVTGGNTRMGNGLKTEIHNYETDTWVSADDYPFSNGDKIVFYATAQTDESIFIIGGYTNGRPHTRTTIVAEYKNDSWSNVGNLLIRRYNHVALSLGSTVMIIAGGNHPDHQTVELLDLNTIESQMINPLVDLATGFFIVPSGYCSMN